jgi:hypothetical protein
METGQGQPAPDTLDDLASFLVDNPEADETERKPNAKEPDEDNSDSDADDDAPADEEDDESDSEDAEEQPSGIKFKVPVKADDGTESTVEVDQKELIAGYQRHSDYTRKTMELADKERQAFQVVTTKIEEGRNHYMQQAQLAHAAVQRLAGLRNSQEMAQLAQNDPAAWVAEQQRSGAIQGVLQQLEMGMNQERAQTMQQQQNAKAEQYDRAWVELTKDGIDKPKLAGIYKTITSKYGVSADQLAGVDNPNVVRIMRDAAAYQDLKDRKGAVTKKVQDAPKLPAQRQSVPKNEQRSKAINQRFATGKAKLGDLAAYLENM